MTLAHGISLRYDDAVGFINRSAHVGLKLCAVNLAIAMYGIYLAIIVK